MKIINHHAFRHADDFHDEEKEFIYSSSIRKYEKRGLKSDELDVNPKRKNQTSKNRKF